MTVRTAGEYTNGQAMRIIVTPTCRNFYRAAQLLRSMGGTFHEGTKVWKVVRKSDRTEQNYLNAPHIYGLEILTNEAYNKIAQAYNDSITKKAEEAVA